MMAQSTATAAMLGPWVRLDGISITKLPPGGKAANSNNTDSNEAAVSTTGPDLQTFITEILKESVPFIDGVAPKSGTKPTWKRRGSPRTFTSCAAPVQLSERTVLRQDLAKVAGGSSGASSTQDETWFCRRSCHKSKAERKTASWNEFVHSFKEHHAETEKAFTPTVAGAREAMRWDASGIEVEVPGGERWNRITLGVEEMWHRINPKPLKDRTFSVVQLTATLVGADEFLVVSIPVYDFEKSPYAEYAKDKNLVVGAYASIERIRILPGSGTTANATEDVTANHGHNGDGEVEWIMATASDAKGNLPQWMQKMAVPSAVAKDVDMFMTWIPSQRSS